MQNNGGSITHQSDILSEIENFIIVDKTNINLLDNNSLSVCLYITNMKTFVGGQFRGSV